MQYLFERPDGVRIPIAKDTHDLGIGNRRLTYVVNEKKVKVVKLTGKRTRRLPKEPKMGGSPAQRNPYEVLGTGGGCREYGAVHW